MIFEHFHRVGKQESLKDALYMWVRWITARFGKHLATSVVIRSNPGDFLKAYFCLTNLTSLGVKCLTEGNIGKWESRKACRVFVFLSENMFRWG